MKRYFFWSARTLRCDMSRFDPELPDVPIIEVHDILGVRGNCVFAYGTYGELIARLLNEYFSREESDG